MTSRPRVPETGGVRWTKRRMRLWIGILCAAVVVVAGGVTAAVLLTPRGITAGPRLTGATIADAGTVAAVADGDLWPNCWSDDDNLYAAFGDGSGFGDTSTDIGVTKITGGVKSLDGKNLAIGDQVGQVWSGYDYTRKPTGMACVNGDLYLAVQDLRKDFNKAPAATIATSTDKGKTWTWDKKAPMFSHGVFTTVMFLDYGKNYDNAPNDYVYAYGLDGNWRDSYDDAVKSPEDLYLARVPSDSIQDIAKWQFYTGMKQGEPTWTSDIAKKKPVLHDGRHLYANLPSTFAHDLTTISQGGIVYDAGLKRYIYTSWTEYTFEFYDAPTPWGPWKLFTSKDFGPYPWSDQKYGGYGLSIPSKFISKNGKSVWVQSNVCPCAPAGMSRYFFSLRPMTIKQK